MVFRVPRCTHGDMSGVWVNNGVLVYMLQWIDHMTGYDVNKYYCIVHKIHLIFDLMANIMMLALHLESRKRQLHPFLTLNPRKSATI
jgi:hypothetical protein